MYRTSWFPSLLANPEHPCQPGSVPATDPADRYTDTATLSIRCLSTRAIPRMVFPPADSPPWAGGTCSSARIDSGQYREDRSSYPYEGNRRCHDRRDLSRWRTMTKLPGFEQAWSWRFARIPLCL